MLPRIRRSVSNECILLAGLLAVDFLSRIIIAMRPLACIDGLTIPDDAYISLKIARNIAGGLGPFYGSGFTNGFQPLYVFLTMPLYWIWPHDLVAPVHGALALLSVFDALALFFLWKLIRRHSRSLAAPIFVAVAWIFNPLVIATTLNGLETMIAFCLAVLVFDRYYALNDAPGPVAARRDLLLGGCIGLAIFARIDNIFLLPAIGLAMAVREWEHQMARGRRKAGNDVSALEHEKEYQAQGIWAGYGGVMLKRWGLLALGAGMVNLPWLAYSHHYTGDLFPISGRAVRFMSLAHTYHRPNASWYGTMIRSGIETIWRSNQTLLWIVAGLGVVALAVGLGTRRLTRESAERRLFGLFPILLFSGMLFAAYTTYIFGSWFFGRYLFPVVLACLALAAALLDLLDAMIDHGHPWLVLNVALLACVICFQMKPRDVLPLYASPPDRERGYMNIGLWAHDHFKPGTVVGSSQTGGLAYFAEDLKVINLDGVVNKECYQALVDRRYMDYIRQANVEFVLGWQTNIAFIINHSRNWNPDDLEYVEEIRGFLSWKEPWRLYRVRRD